MPSASDEIRDAIAAEATSSGRGAISFERFMELALYGEHGFYTSGGSAGRRGGDFLTSAEVGPLFGAVIARALDSWWRDLGSPDDFTVVEVGAGPGTLARAVLAAAPACIDSLRYVAVELSAAQRARHPAGVESTPTLPAAPITGVVLANELLDNLPFRLFVMDDGWREAHVIADGDGFAEVLAVPADIDRLALPADAPLGARLPVQRAAGEWVRSARSLLDRGRVIVIDYTRPTTAELATAPWRAWLRTYRGHEQGHHYLREPGTQDITNDVVLDQLVRAAGEPDVFRTQSQFLQRWGIDELVDEGRRVWAEQSSRPGLAAMMMRSRISEAEALLAEPGLGSFSVLEYAVAGSEVLPAGETDERLGSTQ